LIIFSEPSVRAVVHRPLTIEGFFTAFVRFFPQTRWAKPAPGGRDKPGAGNGEYPYILGTGREVAWKSFKNISGMLWLSKVSCPSFMPNSEKQKPMAAAPLKTIRAALTD